jgi:hypothetical protein
MNRRGRNGPRGPLGRSATCLPKVSPHPPRVYILERAWVGTMTPNPSPRKTSETDPTDCPNGGRHDYVRTGGSASDYCSKCGHSEYCTAPPMAVPAGRGCANLCRTTAQHPRDEGASLLRRRLVTCSGLLEARKLPPVSEKAGSAQHVRVTMRFRERRRTTTWHLLLTLAEAQAIGRAADGETNLPVEA